VVLALNISCLTLSFPIHSRVLVGTGRACYETLRPLAYSLLAEIVHHVRSDLSLSQVLFLMGYLMSILLSDIKFLNYYFISCFHTYVLCTVLDNYWSVLLPVY
jgi:hypothetical protein